MNLSIVADERIALRATIPFLLVNVSGNFFFSRPAFASVTIPKQALWQYTEK